MAEGIQEPDLWGCVLIPKGPGRYRTRPQVPDSVHCDIQIKHSSLYKKNFPSLNCYLKSYLLATIGVIIFLKMLMS